MASTQELACVYAALILQDEKKAITADQISAILKAANVTVEPFWPGLFAKALEGVNVADLISNIGSGAGSAGPAAAAPAAAAAAPAAAKKEKEPVKEESEDEDMGFGLFD
uniref:60S acidic ribosomal protein P1 n=1 Tax=Rhabditophanes sp. KR3021 TaxID=114890 RepID=A0AC35TRY2_9BILA